MSQGPNVKRLIIQKMSTDAIPKGGGLADAVGFLSNKDRIIDGAKQATAWVELALCAVREAAEPNPWKNADDEAIAAHLLEQIQKRKVARK